MNMEKDNTQSIEQAAREYAQSKIACVGGQLDEVERAFLAGSSYSKQGESAQVWVEISERSLSALPEYVCCLWIKRPVQEPPTVGTIEEISPEDFTHFLPMRNSFF